MSTRHPILAAAAILLPLLVPAPGVAQFMYLDANGDGVPSAGDVLSPTDTTWVDIWLRTDQNRDGSPVTCTSGEGPLTFFSYEFILRAAYGTVRWGPYVNRQDPMNVHFDAGVSGGDYHDGYGGTTFLPQGVYRLGTLGVVVASGTPWLQIVPDSPSKPVWWTAFGSECLGRDVDNTLKLGSDWFDTSGLGWGDPSLHAPVMWPIPDVIAYGGLTTDVPVTATDVDGNLVLFSKVAGPDWMSVETLDPGPGTATGRIRLTPATGSASTTGTVGASDGIWTVTDSFAIDVRRYNTPPTLGRVADMTVAEGSVATQWVWADDPDGQDLVFALAEAPPFASVEPAAGYYGRAWLTVAPLPGDRGLYHPVMSVTDGEATARDTFQVSVVIPANRVPSFDPLPNLVVFEGADTTLALAATDPDGDTLQFRGRTAPDWVSVSTLSSGPGTATGAMLVAPAYSDSGVPEFWIDVTDGELNAMQWVHVRVRDAFSGETSLRLESEQGDGIGGGRTYAYTEGDGPHLVRDRADGSVWYTFTLPCTLNVFSTPAERASCVSGIVATWGVLLAAPGGAPLAVGEYPNARVGVVPLPGNPILSVSGVDPYRNDARVCASGTGRFTIHRLERSVLGKILSFHATFEQLCDGSTAPLRGEIRYHAMLPAIALNAPTRVRAAQGRALAVAVGAACETGDPIALAVEDLPAGAAFVDRGDGTGVLGWTPGPGQRGAYYVTFLAAGVGGLRDTASTWIEVSYTNHAPVAEANGPYAGTAGLPVRMTSAGSYDPDGDRLTYYWDFGDGEGDGIASPEHVYARAGNFVVTLTVADGTLFDSDATLAFVGDPLPAMAFVTEGSGTVRLAHPDERLCVGVEVEPGPKPLDDVLPNGYWMLAERGGAADSIAADPSTVRRSDVNGNGILEAAACFRGEDLRRLFAGVQGRVEETVQLHLRMVSGRFIDASLRIEVVAPEGTLPVVVAPNPMNPGGVLTVVTSLPGPVRVRLYDTAGRLVRTLLDSASLPAGYHDVPVDGRSDRGTPLSSSAYFYRVEAAEGSRTGRIAIVR